MINVRAGRRGRVSGGRRLLLADIHTLASLLAAARVGGRALDRHASAPPTRCLPHLGATPSWAGLFDHLNWRHLRRASVINSPSPPPKLTMSAHCCAWRAAFLAELAKYSRALSKDGRSGAKSIARALYARLNDRSADAPPGKARIGATSTKLLPPIRATPGPTSANIWREAQNLLEQPAFVLFPTPNSRLSTCDVRRPAGRLIEPPGARPLGFCRSPGWPLSRYCER